MWVFVRWFGGFFFAQCLLRLGKRFLKQEVVENDKWLEHFRIVLELLYCLFLTEFWKEEGADFSGLPSCIAHFRVLTWVDFKIIFPSVVKFHQVHN